MRIIIMSLLNLDDFATKFYWSSLREKCPNTEFFLVRIWTFFTQWLQFVPRMITSLLIPTHIVSLIQNFQNYTVK